MGSIIKMYAAITGGNQDALATIDIPNPGHIVGVDWRGAPILAGTDFVMTGQLSFRSSSSFTTNDDRGIISEVSVASDITTSGGNVVIISKYVQIPDLPVMGGERLYIHVSSTASVIGPLVALVHFDFDMDKVSMRRR